MLYPTAQEWGQWGVTANLHRFFALHWAEMLHNDTPDTWQVRTCNIRTILEEVIDAARTAEKIETYRHVLRALLDEAFSVIRRDAAVARFYPFVVQYLEPWRNRDISASDAPEIERVASVVLGNLEGYWGRAVEVVLEMVAEGNSQWKLELYDAAMTAAVEAVARGHSPEYIRSLLLEKVLVTRPEPFKDRVEETLGLLSRKPATYTCTFIPKGVKRLVAGIAPPDISVRVGPPAAAAAGPEVEFYNRGNQLTVYLSVKVTAVDQESARHVAEQRLFQFFAGLNLYGVEDPLGLAHPDALVEDADGKKWRVGERGEIAYLANAKSMYPKAGTLFQVHQRLGSEDAAQLMAALQYHRLALTATSDEARFINLWVALESLCQGGNGSIIDRVCTRIPPCVSIGNVRKTFAALARYIRYLWTDADRPQFLALFPNSNTNVLRQEDLLRVMLLKPGSPDLLELFRLTARHPLICHRVFRVKAKMLDRPKSLAENLRFTRRNVEWQLKRIYRIRNEIVHRGSSSPRILRQLTQHLHTYLVTATQGIVYELDRQPRWSMRDALEHKRRLFDHVVSFFDSTDGTGVAVQALLNPMHCLESQREPFAWVPDEPTQDYQI